MRLSSADRALVAAAKDAIRRGFLPEWHHVGAAIRTPAGRIYTAVNLDAYVGSCAVCAEACALGAAYAAGERAFDTCVAVRWTGRGEPLVVAPCGKCRELLFDYGDPYVLHPKGASIAKTRVRRLLPEAYERPGEHRGDPATARPRR
jgi:cytidine deaminase